MHRSLWALEVVLIPGDAASRRDSEGEWCPTDMAGFTSFLVNETMQQNPPASYVAAIFWAPFWCLETTFAVSRSMFPIFGRVPSWLQKFQKLIIVYVGLLYCLLRRFFFSVEPAVRAPSKPKEHRTWDYESSRRKELWWHLFGVCSLGGSLWSDIECGVSRASKSASRSLS